MEKTVLIKNGTLLTMDGNDSIAESDLLVRGRLIASVGESVETADEVIDARGCAVMPGFVQTHVHLCQTLFRGAADDLALIDWLKRRVWPMEAAHTARSARASAQLAVAEMIKGGTTCALTMETVNHTGEAFRVVEEAGFRATIGKCMMDKGDEVPDALQEETAASIRESLALLEEWHGRAGGRLRYCFAPRFAVSCTRELLERVAHLANQHGVIVHTHASENRDEVALVERETGLRNIEYLQAVGLVGPRVVLAHCVQLSDDEMAILARLGANVAHCPSSNLKLGSGIARIAEMIERGIPVTIGADGAPCNNRLDMFTEMRTAALLQKVLGGPEALPARTVLRMATIDGARALGLGDEIGSIEAGKRADLILMNLDALHTTPHPDTISTIVYAAQSSDVERVWIDGRMVLGDGRLTTMDERAVRAAARLEAAKIAAQVAK